MTTSLTTKPVFVQTSSRNGNKKYINANNNLNPINSWIPNGSGISSIIIITKDIINESTKEYTNIIFFVNKTFLSILNLLDKYLTGNKNFSLFFLFLFLFKIWIILNV